MARKTSGTRLGAGRSGQGAVARRRAGNATPKELPAVVWRDVDCPFLLDVPVKPRAKPRKIWTRGKLGSIPSRKTGRDVIITSEAESYLAYECEWDDDVTFYLEQPFGIRYRCDGTPALYPPDMYRLRDGRHEIVEAKTAEGAAAEEWKAREPWIRDALEKLGFHFVLWVLEIEAPQPRGKNIWRQIGDRKLPVPDCAEAICGHLAAVGPSPLWQVSRDLGVPFEPLRIMVAHRLLDADIDQPFDEDIVLSCDIGGEELPCHG